MILRLVRMSFELEDVRTVLEGLRREMPRADAVDGLHGWAHGLRREGTVVHGLTLSFWDDIGSIVAAADARRSAELTAVEPWASRLSDVEVDHYELVDPLDERSAHLDGAALSIAWGTTRPYAEGVVHEMIQRIGPTVAAAGVTSWAIGRRIAGRRSELVATAIWRDRLSLRAFGRSRSREVIGTAFSSRLADWHFETYDAITLSRLERASAGPAFLVVDEEQRCIDASPGVDRLLAMPGEAILHRRLDELVEASSLPALRDLWAAVEGGGSAAGALALVLPTGRLARLRVEVEAGVPAEGLAMMALSPEPRSQAHPDNV